MNYVTALPNGQKHWYQTNYKKYFALLCRAAGVNFYGNQIFRNWTDFATDFSYCEVTSCFYIP